MGGNDILVVEGLYITSKYYDFGLDNIWKETVFFMKDSNICYVMRQFDPR